MTMLEPQMEPNRESQIDSSAPPTPVMLQETVAAGTSVLPWGWLPFSLVPLICLLFTTSTIRAWVAPASPQRSPLPPAQLPSSLPLPQWKTLGSDAIEGGQRYRYQRSDLGFTRPLQLTIELQEMNAFRANSSQFQRDAAISRSFDTQLPQVKSLAGVGSYALHRDRTTAFLSTCLTPQGVTAGRYEDYLLHSHGQGIAPLRFVQWLSGTGAMRDARCLWAKLSIPLVNGGDEQGEVREAEGIEVRSPTVLFPYLEQVWQQSFPHLRYALPLKSS